MKLILFFAVTASALFLAPAPCLAEDYRADYRAIDNPAAGIPKVRAADVRCKDLQTALEQEGVLFIMTGPWDWGVLHYWDGQYCDGRKQPNPSYVSTSDKTFCYVGYVCQRRP